MTIKVHYANGTEKEYTKEEFIENFRHDDKIILEEHDLNVGYSSGKEWAELFDSTYAEDFDIPTILFEREEA